MFYTSSCIYTRMLFLYIYSFILLFIYLFMYLYILFITFILTPFLTLLFYVFHIFRIHEYFQKVTLLSLLLTLQGSSTRQSSSYTFFFSPQMLTQLAAVRGWKWKKIQQLKVMFIYNVIIIWRVHDIPRTWMYW